jgi:hypothetical protein
MFGKTHSEHSKELMSLVQLGKKNPQWVNNYLKVLN